MASDVWINGQAYTSAQHKTVVLLGDGQEVTLPGLQKIDYDDTYTRSLVYGEGGGVIGKATEGKYEDSASWSMATFSFLALQTKLKTYGLAQDPPLAVGKVDFDVLVTRTDGSAVVADRIEKCHLAKRKLGYDNTNADPSIYEGDLAPAHVYIDGSTLDKA